MLVLDLEVTNGLDHCEQRCNWNYTNWSRKDAIILELSATCFFICLTFFMWNQTCNLTEHCNRLPREVVESLSQEIRRSHLDMVQLAAGGPGHLQRSLPTSAILKFQKIHLEWWACVPREKILVLWGFSGLLRYSFAGLHGLKVVVEENIRGCELEKPSGWIAFSCSLTDGEGNLPQL